MYESFGTFEKDMLYHCYLNGEIDFVNLFGWFFLLIYVERLIWSIGLMMYSIEFICTSFQTFYFILFKGIEFTLSITMVNLIIIKSI